jgi:hypothetical protein
MSGRTITTTVTISQGPADSGPGGGSSPVQKEAHYAWAAGESSLVLTDAVTPAPLPVPAGGARVISIRVVDPGTVAPTLILVSTAGTAQLPIDGSFHIESSPTGPAYSAVSVKGVCEIAYLLGG